MALPLSPGERRYLPLWLVAFALVRGCQAVDAFPGAGRETWTRVFSSAFLQAAGETVAVASVGVGLVLAWRYWRARAARRAT